VPFSPKRSLKMQELFRDERYLTLDPSPRLLMLTLLHYTDALGREVASSTSLSDLLYEFDAKVTPGQIDKMLTLLESRSWLLLYESGRRRYMQVNPVAWKAFVSIDGRDGSQYPPPDPGPVAAQGHAWGDPGPTAAEGKGDGGGAPPLWMSDPDMPPPQGCRMHPLNTGLIACGACAGARKIHADFIAGRISHAQAVAAWTTATAEGES
jgi:hypothetical protein